MDFEIGNGGFVVYCAWDSLPDADHTGDERFRQLADECGEGDTDAMLRLADYFEGLGSHEFYKCAANFWRFRAAKKSNEEAIEWVNQWIEANPNQRMPSLFSSEMPSGDMGRVLRYAGFLSFDEDREYDHIRRPDKNGIVRVSSWCGDDGPDEDGFGREEYYDWWFLDENLKKIDGVDMLHGYSFRETTYSRNYKELYEKAVSVVKSRKTNDM